MPSVGMCFAGSCVTGGQLVAGRAACRASGWVDLIGLCPLREFLGFGALRFCTRDVLP